MGEFFIRDRDGLLRGFRVKGDQPSESEMARISSRLNGTPAPQPQTEEDPGLLGRIGRGMSRSVDDAQASVFSSLEGLSHAQGSDDWAEYFRKKADEQRAQRDTVTLPDDQDYLAGRVATALGESTGQMVAGTAGMIAGAAAGTAMAGPPGTIAGGVLGAGAASFPFMFNSNMERQIQEQGDVKDYGKAALAATGQAAIEGVTDTITGKVAGIIGRPLSKAFDKAVSEGTKKGWGLLAKRVGDAAMVGVPSGAIEESTQQALERWQANLPMMDEKAQAEYLESAIVGGILEGGIGASFGTVGGIKDIQDAKAEDAAKKYAREEAERLGTAVKDIEPANRQRREAEELEPVAGLLQDQRAAPAAPSQIEVGGEVQNPFSEEEYGRAVELHRSDKSISPDKLKKNLSIGRNKADAIFREMLKRGDAEPTGSLNQYARIKPRRSFLVSTVDDGDVNPFRVTRKGRSMGNNFFKSEEDAKAWAEAQNISDYEITSDKNNQKYGVYETQFEGDKPISKRLVKSFGTSGEAQAHANTLDPKFSAETNEKNKQLVEQRNQERIAETVKKELGPHQKLLQKLADAIVGKGRASIEVIPKITKDYLKSIGVQNTDGISDNLAIEGVTMPDAKKVVKNIVALAADLHKPEDMERGLNDVLNHELVHVLRNLDILTRKEWDGLFKYALDQKVPGQRFTHMQLAVARRSSTTPDNMVAEEGIAEMLRLYAKDPTAFEQKSPLKKLMDFIRKLIGLGKRYGAEDTMKAIFGGEMASRPEGYGKLGDRYPGNPAFSSVKVPGFYMKSDKVFSNLKQEKGTADQWKGIIRNSGIKKEELQWLGLNEYIDKAALAKKEAGQSPQITRGEILDYIRANGLDIMEDVNSLKNDIGPIALEAKSFMARKWGVDVKDIEDKFGYRNPIDYIILAKQNGYIPSGITHHDYTTQTGGKDYTELLLHLPGLEPEFKVDSHFDGFPNIIASTRFKTRIFDNKKTLFIEEIQSDLHQRGKKDGYARTLSEEEKIEKHNQAHEVARLRDIYVKLRDSNRFHATEEEDKAYDEWRSAKAAFNEKWGGSKVPNAPFKTSWDELAFKRLVRYAVDNDFDQVAWHGEPQSIADTEKYPGIDEHEDDNGNFKYTIGNPDVHAQDVTGIVNFYLKRLKNIASDAFKSFGATPRYVAAKAESLDFSDIFDNPDDIGSFVANMHPPEALAKKLIKAAQIMRNQREMDANAAFQAAGITMEEMDEAFGEDKTGNKGKAPFDENGNPNYAKWVMPVTEDLRRSTLDNGFPLFSAVETRQAQDRALNDENFVKWFGESKVVDDEGRPLVVYHGTGAKKDFSIFNNLSHFGTAQAAEDRINSVLPYDVSSWTVGKRLGMKPKDIAEWWRELSLDERERLVAEQHEINREAWSTARIYPVFLKITNPLTIYDSGLSHGEDTYSLTQAVFNADGITRDEMYDLGRLASQEDLIDLLKSKGYDGFKYINNVEDRGSLSYVAFEPNQVKSIFNSKWDPRDPRIHFSAVDLTETPEFKAWFGDSKITKDGKPRLMYHGTVHDFDAFDRNVNPNDMDHGWYGKGFYFTPYPTEAKLYAQRRVKVPLPNDWSEVDMDFPSSSEYTTNNPGIRATLSDYTGGNIMPVYLSIKNPYIWKGPSLSDHAGAVNQTQTIKDNGYDGIIRMGNDDMWEVIAFEPSQIKSAFNRGTFDPNDPRITYSSVDVAPKYAATAPLGQRVPQQPPKSKLDEIEARTIYNALAPRVQKLSKIMGGTFKYAYEQKVEDTFINFQDRMLPVGKLIDRMRKNGGFITNENDPYLREQLFSGQTDTQINDNDKAFYTPLVKAIEALKVTSADAKDAAKLNASAKSIVGNYPSPKKALTELYLYALHAQERNAKMRERNENLAASRPLQYSEGSGMSDAEARQIKAWFANHRFSNDFAIISALHQRIVQSTNDIRVAGLLNPDFRKLRRKDGSLVDDYKFYAPIRSWIEEHQDGDDDSLEFAKAGRGFNIRGKEDFSATGRMTLGANIVEHTILQNEEAIVRANKNKVGLSMVKLIRENPDLMKGVAEIIVEKPRRVVYDKKSGRAKMAVDHTFSDNPMVLNVKEGDKQLYVKFADERLAKAMGSRTSLGNAGVGSLFKGFLWFNRILAATRTSYNPEFLVSNMLRDLMAATVNISEVELQGIRREVLSSVTPALRGVWHALRTGDMSSGWAKDFDDFRKHGGQTAFYGLRQLAGTLEKTNKALQGDSEKGALGKTWSRIKPVFDFIEDANLAIENGTRLATYKALRDRFIAMGNPNDAKYVTRAKEQAARISKNLTVNFNMGGELKPFMNAMYMFYNANLQGSAALLNPFVRSARVKKIWGAVVVAGIMQDILNSLLGDGDDYDKIPEYVLAHNIVIMNPLSERGYIKFPLPYLMNGIYNFGRSLSRSIRGGYTPGEGINSMFGTLAESLNPIGAANTWLNFVAPTIFDPVVDLYNNQDFTGKPIAPEASPYGVSEIASQRYWNNTNPLFVTIADWTSKLTGSDGTYIPGAAEVSPNQVAYVYDYLFGGAGNFLARSYGLAAGVAGQRDDDGPDWNDIPFLRSVIGSVSPKNDMQDYIGNRDRVLKVRAEMKLAAKEGDHERYLELMKRYPEEYKVAARVNKIENLRKKISARINKIRGSKTIPEDKKNALIKELKDRQNELVGTANNLFD